MTAPTPEPHPHPPQHPILDIFARNLPTPALGENHHLGFGSSGMSRDWVSDETAQSAFDAAWEAGIRYIDTAPFYGTGRSEVLVGRALKGIPRDDYVLSTKVGRTVLGAPTKGEAGTGWEFDFSADAIKRSIDESLTRLGLDRIDLLYIHDANEGIDQAIAETFPVLADLRDQGVIRAIGTGLTTVDPFLRFARETEMDWFLVAGRYSLLVMDGLAELLPLAQEKGIGIVVAQTLAGGLIDGQPNPRLHYQPLDEATQAKVARIASTCHRHGVPTAAAAIQFPLAHPAVRGLLTGPETGEQMRQNLGWWTLPIPDALWTDLKAEGLLPANAPVPPISDAH
ncbi:MAG: aldo/keto reductase [Thermomicrobiales bacterium]